MFLIINNKNVNFDEKFPFQREQPFNFHQTDYKAPLLSLTSQFDKVLYIGLNISIKRAGIQAEMHCYS